MKLIARPLLIAALALAPAVAARAQPAPAAAPPADAASRAGTTEKDRLGAQFIHMLFDAAKFDLAKKLAEAGEIGEMFKDVKDRPEWPDMMRAAVAEEAGRDMPQIELALAHAMFADFSLADLRAGIGFAATPGGREIVVAIANGQSLARAAKLSPEARKAAAAMNASPDGRAFLAKFAGFDGDLASAAGRPVVRLLLPGAMVAFADKVKVAEGQRPAPVSATPEADQLGGELAHMLFVANDVGTVLKGQVGDFSTTLSDPVFPPEWAGLMREAVAEEVEQDIPVLEGLFGRALALHFTLEELRAGVALLKGPTGKILMAGLAADRAGKPRPEPSMADRKTMEAFMKTPTGRDFMSKVATLDKIKPEDSLQEFLIVFLPQVMGRFGEKVLANEAAMAAVS